jgi:hypothetical protein
MRIVVGFEDANVWMRAHLLDDFAAGGNTCALVILADVDAKVKAAFLT